MREKEREAERSCDILINAAPLRRAVFEDYKRIYGLPFDDDVLSQCSVLSRHGDIKGDAFLLTKDFLPVTLKATFNDLYSISLEEFRVVKGGSSCQPYGSVKLANPLEQIRRTYPRRSTKSHPSDYKLLSPKNNVTG